MLRWNLRQLRPPPAYPPAPTRIDGPILEFLDDYAQSKGFDSRSAVVHQAVRLLRSSELESDYAGAWAEWVNSPEGGVWDVTIADGLIVR